MTKTKTYPTFTINHNREHFRKAMNEEQRFYFDDVLCYCTMVSGNLVRIHSVNPFNEKYNPSQLIELKP